MLSTNAVIDMVGYLNFDDDDTDSRFHHDGYPLTKIDEPF